MTARTVREKEKRTEERHAASYDRGKGERRTPRAGEKQGWAADEASPCKNIAVGCRRDWLRCTQD